MLRRLFVFLAMILFCASGLLPPQHTSRAVAAGQTFGYGFSGNDFDAASAAGFNWTKLLASWEDIEPSRGSYSGSALSVLASGVDGARSRGLNVLVNISHSPAWATGTSSSNAPPINDNDLADFMAYLANYFRGRIAAYEIWNEPNLRIEWGMQQPDPVKYASMLRGLYPRVKAADPNALVITGGLSTAGDGIGYWNYGDLLYIQNLYLQGNVKSCSDGAGGTRSCFDALGSHPYGGPFSPETAPDVAQYTVGMYFRRAEQQKQMMDVWGQDYSRGVFATELNWLLDPSAFGVSCNWGSGWDAYKLSGTASQQEATQADYLVRAFNYAYTNWSWMQGMIVFSLDYQGTGGCDQVRWYSLTRADGTRRPAYSALSSMAKPGLPSPLLQIDTNTAVFMIDPRTATIASRVIRIRNADSGTLGWTATKTTATWLSLSSSSGSAPSNLTLTASRSGLANGTYNATVTVSGATSTRNSPQQIAVKLYVGTVHQSQLSVTKND